MEKRRLLISYAHPDDESFGLGAAIPKWIDEGVDVYLICATNGDVGDVPDELRGKYSTIAELRLSELHCARQYLKFREVFMLGYRDSGMPGSETSRHPDSLCYQSQHHPARVANAVIDVLRRVKPQVVDYLQSLWRLWSSGPHRDSEGNRTCFRMPAKRS